MQANIYHLLKIQSEGMPQERKNPLMHSLKFSELKTLVGGKVIARELAAPWIPRESGSWLCEW